ncbi:recombinase A [Bremerella volcania]|uniref:Recombinase A n=1 Tax=Bremerella volcania TaxID=2527984 RepID=A0A518C9H5_9BACT|nr:hypothetical protein [Bremerella volcania]QDU75878.1 recombinase A [Bremerella volcania]
MSTDHHFNDPRQTIADLQQQIRSLERGTVSTEITIRKTGCLALDTMFPQQGVRPGSLVEWIESGTASGAGTLSLLIGRQVCQPMRPIFLIDPRQQLYPPSLAALGIDLSRLVLVRPTTKRDALWACEEALRSRSAGIVWAQIDHLSVTAARRLRLAVEDSESVCFLIRPHQALQQPSWAEVRLVVEPQPSHSESPRYRVSVAYSQGRTLRSTTDIQIDRHRGTIDEFSHPATKGSLLLVS